MKSSIGDGDELGTAALAYWDALNCRGRDMLHQTLPTHSFIAQLPTSIARTHACLTVLGSGRHLLTVSWVDRTPDEASVWWRNDWLIVCLKWISAAKQSVAHIYWMSSSLRSIVNTGVERQFHYHPVQSWTVCYYNSLRCGCATENQTLRSQLVTAWQECHTRLS